VNSWAETEIRFPHDVALRSHGFSIHSRPRRGESFWKRSGKIYIFSRAVKIAESEYNARSRRLLTCVGR